MELFLSLAVVVAAQLAFWALGVQAGVATLGSVALGIAARLASNRR